MANESKEPAKALTVTEGNIVFDKDGVRRVGGENVDLTPEQAKPLRAAKIVE